MLQLRLITSVVPRGGGLSVHKVRGVLWYVASPSVVTAAYNAGCGWNERPFRPNRGTPFSPHLLLCDFFKPPWVPKLDRAPVTGQPCLMGWLSVPLTWRRFNEPSPSWRLSECITLCAFMCARVASESPAVASHFFCAVCDAPKGRDEHKKWHHHYVPGNVHSMKCCLCNYNCSKRTFFYFYWITK